MCAGVSMCMCRYVGMSASVQVCGFVCAGVWVSVQVCMSVQVYGCVCICAVSGLF